MSYKYNILWKHMYTSSVRVPCDGLWLLENHALTTIIVFDDWLRYWKIAYDNLYDKLRVTGNFCACLFNRYCSSESTFKKSSTSTSVNSDCLLFLTSCVRSEFRFFWCFFSESNGPFHKNSYDRFWSSKKTYNTVPFHKNSYKKYLSVKSVVTLPQF